MRRHWRSSTNLARSTQTFVELLSKWNEQNTLQGGITTRNGSVLGEKNPLKQPLKSRNALGDISNRGRAVNNGYGLANKVRGRTASKVDMLKKNTALSPPC
jgi:hypothetical protein